MVPSFFEATLAINQNDKTDESLRGFLGISGISVSQPGVSWEFGSLTNLVFCLLVSAIGVLDGLGLNPTGYSQRDVIDGG